MSDVTEDIKKRWGLNEPLNGMVDHSKSIMAIAKDTIKELVRIIEEQEEHSAKLINTALELAKEIRELESELENKNG